MVRLASGVASLFGEAPQQPTKEHVYSVSELVNKIRVHVEGQFRTVTLVGEISSFKPWRSGHWYFDLKDEHALLPAVMFKHDCAAVPFEVKEGMQVLATGKVSIYPGQSKVQIVVQKLEPVGQGALALAFEELKKKLSNEGLFSEAHKRSLPKLPKTVGIVTSPEGAALRDMMRILRARNPNISVIVAPTRVQGKGSALEIAQALKQLDESKLCDVIIIGRGGGSLEDLWSFNEEPVARAIFGCETPIVSAVGHETDFTIADFAADKRCATPTHAASEVVPDVAELEKFLSDRALFLRRQVLHRLELNKLNLLRISKRLPEPRMLLMQQAQRVDVLHQRATDRIQRLVKVWNQRIENYRKRIDAHNPQLKLATFKSRESLLEKRLHVAMQRNKSMFQERMALNAAKLAALSPLAVIGRGYAMAQNTQGTPISSIHSVSLGEVIHVKISDGIIESEVQKVLISPFEKGGLRGI